MTRHFCKICGTQVWFEGSFEVGGRMNNIFAVNLHSVDQPQDHVELSDVKMQYYDGLNNNFAAGLKDGPWKGGLL